MRESKVINRNDLLKDQERILKPLEDRVKGIVTDILGRVQANLGAELHGIALEVMEAVMELEISHRSPASREGTRRAAGMAAGAPTLDR